MHNNDGKRWERCIQESCKEQNIFCKKLSDGTSSWGRNDINVRFQKSNECDFIIYGGTKLYLIEAKCHKGKSLPTNCIRPNQISGLVEKTIYPNVVCGLIVLFSELDKSYFLDIRKFVNFTSENDRKSIPLEYFESVGLEVPIIKKRTKYNVDVLHLIRLLDLPF